jgi:hypothetical protein
VLIDIVHGIFVQRLWSRVLVVSFSVVLLKKTVIDECNSACIE